MERKREVKLVLKHNNSYKVLILFRDTTRIVKLALLNDGKKLHLTNILEHNSNVEPKYKDGNEILKVGGLYTIVDSHKGAITGKIRDKDQGSYLIDRVPTGVKNRLQYHDLLFVMETEGI